MPITHAFTSPKSDGADSTLVKPSDWNAEHSVGWTSYTPAFTAATTNPTLGSSTLEGYYIAFSGTVYCVSIILTIAASGWDAGSGSWRLGLPNSKVASGPSLQTGVAHYRDSSTGNYGMGGIRLVDGNDYFQMASGGGTWQAGTPITWADGDTVMFYGMFQVA